MTTFRQPVNTLLTALGIKVHPHDMSHYHTIPTGGAAGLKLGHNIVAPKDTPLCNAWLTLHGIGVQAERHGDSTGV